MTAIIHYLQEPKRTVTQGNQVVSASYKLTLNEKRLLMLVISKVNPLIMPSEMPIFEITRDQWLEAYPDSEHPYRDMKRASKDLMSRHVFIKERTRNRHVNWVDCCDYYDGEGKIELMLTYTISIYLCGCLEAFTSYTLLEVNRLRSIHAIRLYENLARFRNTGWRKWTLEGFREIFAPNGEYKVFAELNRVVITPAVKEINAKTPLNVTYETHRQGRSIAAISFKFKEKTALQKKKLAK